MGSTCSCTSIQNVNTEEINRRSTMSSQFELKMNLQQTISEIEENEISNHTKSEQPDRFIIIYPTQMDNFNHLKQELLQINKNDSFIIREYQNYKLSLEYSSEEYQMAYSSLENFQL